MSTARRWAFLPAAGLLVLAAYGVACGGGGAQAPGPVAGAASASAPVASEAASAAQAPAASGGGSPALPPPAVLAPEAAPVEMKPPVPSGMVDALRDLGLDPKRLPPIEKLEPRVLRGVMKLMGKSLGAKCGDCHQEGDFAAPTRRKKIAAHMWDDFAAKLSLADGSALFCDSCHQGRIRQLDRRDKKALSQWMDDNFVARLARVDGRPTECETCHVDMEMLFLNKWGGR